MVEYESFKKRFMKDCEQGKTAQDCSVIATLKKNAYLVDIIHDAKGLAEDIYANACEIEQTYQTDCWPKYEEDGEPVRIGDIACGLHGKEIVDSIEVSNDGWRLYGRKPPALDEDNSIIREKFIINEGCRFDYAHKTYEYAQSYVIHDDKERM